MRIPLTVAVALGLSSYLPAALPAGREATAYARLTEVNPRWPEEAGPVVMLAD